MVRVEHDASFVVADIPGLIEGAAEGAGLGHQFLRHLSRTRLLLHLVDIAPLGRRAPSPRRRTCARSRNELKKYDASLYAQAALAGVQQDRPLPAPRRRRARARAIVRALRWKAPVVP